MKCAVYYMNCLIIVLYTKQIMISIVYFEMSFIKWSNGFVSVVIWSLSSIGKKSSNYVPLNIKYRCVLLEREKCIANIVISTDHEHDEDEEGDVNASGPIDSRIKGTVH